MKSVLRGGLYAAAAIAAAFFARGVATACHAAEAPSTYRVYPLSDQAAGTTLVVPADRVLRLSLSRLSGDAARPEALELVVTPFTDALGQAVPVALLFANEAAGTPLRHSDARSVTVDRAHIPFRLHVGEMSSPRTVSGHLLLSRDGVEIKSYPITFAPSGADRGAKLKLDGVTTPPALEVTERLLGFGKSEPATFATTLSDDTRNWPLRGLHAKLEEVSGAGFDPRRDIQFAVNGAPVPDFWVTDGRSRSDDPARSVAPGGQAKVVGTVRGDLPAGAYTAKVRLLAENSQEDPGQVLTLKINARKSLPYAVTLLLGGILVSVVTTALLKARAAMLRLRFRILQASPRWLADAGPSLSVTWVRAIFSQGSAFRQVFTVAGTDMLDQRVSEAAEHLPYLEQLTALRRDIGGQGWDPMVQRRARKVLQRIHERLLPGPLDAKVGTSIQEQINGLAAWIGPDPKDAYWKQLRTDIDALLGAVDRTVFDRSHDLLIDGWLKALADTAVPATITEMVHREGEYAALKLMWERRGDAAQVKALVVAWQKGQRIQDLFDLADRASWTRLKARQKELRFLGPRPPYLQPFEPFEPLLFEVGARSADLTDNFLFKHGLTFEWKLTFAQRYGDPKRPPVVLETTEPRIYVYATHKCLIRASVVLRFRGEESAPVTGGPDDTAAFDVAVDGSAFKRLMRSVETTETVSLGLAVVVGVATGLLTQYVGNATFGSMRDCIGLFLWGVGSDQASKSFLDVLNRFPRFSIAGNPASSAASAANGTQAPTAPAGPSAIPPLAPTPGVP